MAMAAVGGAAAGAGGGLIGSGLQYVFNKKLMKFQQQFQERMSNTQYQRTMADMRRAGLNPILAAKLGGGSTPPGASGSVSQTDIVSSAKQGFRMKKEMQLLEAQIQTERLRGVNIDINSAKTATESTLLGDQAVASGIRAEFDRSPLGTAGVQQYRARELANMPTMGELLRALAGARRK